MGVGPGYELTGYNTILDTLKLQNIINSRAFSLDLRSVDSPDGAIIFGGLDTKKFTGALEKTPIIPAAQAPDGFNRYWIQMDAVGITKPGQPYKKYANSGTPVFPDSGGTLSRLPTSIFNAILADFPGATEDGTSGIYLVDCSVASQAGTVDFTFGSTTIHVSYNDFIWHIQGYCYLGVAADDNAPVLGDSFLRAAYVIYDQDNQNLLLANAANCGTNLVAIGSGKDAVPSITGGCGGSTSTSSSSSSSSSSYVGSVTSSFPYSPSGSATYSPSVSATYTPTASATYVPSASATYVPSGSVTYYTSASVSTSYSSTDTSIYAPVETSTYSPGSVTKYPVYTTSTVYETSVHTTLGQVTTEVKSYTTVCPYEEETTTAAPVETMTVVPVAYPTTTSYTMSTVYATTTYTISKCAETVTNCPYGSKTTETVSLYTTLCPVEAEATSYHVAEAQVYNTAGLTTTTYSTETLTSTIHRHTYSASAGTAIPTYAAGYNATVTTAKYAQTNTAAGVSSSTPSAAQQFTGAAEGLRVGSLLVLGAAGMGVVALL